MVRQKNKFQKRRVEAAASPVALCHPVIVSTPGWLSLSFRGNSPLPSKQRRCLGDLAGATKTKRTMIGGWGGSRGPVRLEEPFTGRRTPLFPLDFMLLSVLCSRHTPIVPGPTPRDQHHLIKLSQILTSVEVTPSSLSPQRR